ncbi:MAG: oligosaccharide flippase family protein [Candidatus Gottesmanbacteria bacterium]
MKKKVAFNTIAQVIGKIISGGTTFLVSLILARSLGVEGYGDFTKITTYIAFFYLFCDFGLNAAYLQLIEKQTVKQIRNVLFTTRILFGLLLMFITLAITAFLPGSDSQGYSMVVKMGIVLFVPSIFFQSIITTTNVLFQERLRYDFATYAVAIGSLTTLLSIYISSKIFLPTAALLGSIIAFLIGSIVTSVVALLFVKKLSGMPTLTWNPQLTKRLILQALPLGLTLVCNVIYFHADSFILTLTRSTSDVGTYGLAYKFFELILVIPTFFMNAMFPLLMASKKSSDEKQLQARVRMSGIILILLSLLIGIGGWFAAPFISLIRPEFNASICPLRILLAGLPIFYLTSLSMWILIVERKQKQMLGIYTASMAINIICNIIFIPQYGYIAAAWITVMSELFVLTFSYITLKRA